MRGLGQRLWDPHSLFMGGKARSNFPGSGCGGAEVLSTRRTSLWVKLQRSLREGAWNVLTLREDDEDPVSAIILAPAFEHQF